MNATVERSGVVALLTVQDHFLGTSNSAEFKRQVAGLLESSARVVIDLSQVELVDSAGCGAVLTCLHLASQVGGNLQVCGMTVRVRETFALFRMDRILELHPSRAAALQAVTP